MKLVLVHFTFVDYTVGLANALADHCDVTMIHPTKIAQDCAPVTDARIKRLSFDKPRLRSLKNIPAMQNLIRLIRAEKPDIVHLQTNGEPWFELALLVNELPPLVTTIHDVFPHPGDRASFSLPGAKYTARIPYYRSQQLIVHTQQQKQDLTEKLRVQPERVNVVALGHYGDVYRAWAGGSSKPREPFTLLFFGRLWPYKGLRFLLEAMPLIAERVPEVKLIIAGRGENLKNYFPNGIDSSRYEVRDGFIPNQEVAGLFQRSTVTVLPYTEASQSGVAAISYGLGTPVVASRVGGLPEIIRDGEDGLLVPPDDAQALANAVIRLLLDPELQQKMQAAMARRCQDDLNWSPIATATMDVYRKMLGS